jgi:hypothetical protein
MATRQERLALVQATMLIRAVMLAAAHDTFAPRQVYAALGTAHHVLRGAWAGFFTAFHAAPITTGVLPRNMNLVLVASRGISDHHDSEWATTIGERQ